MLRNGTESKDDVSTIGCIPVETANEHLAMGDHAGTDGARRDEVENMREQKLVLVICQGQETI